jgi:hypothetical protein
MNPVKKISVTGTLTATALLFAGCASELPPKLAPQPDPATAYPKYWLSKPAAASVLSQDYEMLWDACGDVARDDLFTVDRQDYRDGLLTTQPLISRQFFEFWRPDTGDAKGVVMNSLQTIRRTIRFDFEKLPDGYAATPRVLVERLSQPEGRVTSPAQYRGFFSEPTLPEEHASRFAEAELGTYGEDWYAIGRDYKMEEQLAQAVKQRLERSRQNQPRG